MNEELLKKAREAKSAEELLEMAKKNGIELTEERAKEYFERFNANGEISDEELEEVAGGCGDSRHMRRMIHV